MGPPGQVLAHRIAVVESCVVANHVDFLEAAKSEPSLFSLPDEPSRPARRSRRGAIWCSSPASLIRSQQCHIWLGHGRTNTERFLHMLTFLLHRRRTRLSGSAGFVLCALSAFVSAQERELFIGNLSPLNITITDVTITKSDGNVENHSNHFWRARPGDGFVPTDSDEVHLTGRQVAYSAKVDGTDFVIRSRGGHQILLRSDLDAVLFADPAWNKVPHVARRTFEYWLSVRATYRRNQFLSARTPLDFKGAAVLRDIANDVEQLKTVDVDPEAVKVANELVVFYREIVKVLNGRGLQTFAEAAINFSGTLSQVDSENKALSNAAEDFYALHARVSDAAEREVRVIAAEYGIRVAADAVSLHL